MTPVELSRTVLRAVRRAVDAGELSVTVPERAVVTVPGPGGCGDYATGIALQLARPAGLPPRDVAEIIRARLLTGRAGQADDTDQADQTDHADDTDHRIEDVVITGPGFLNIRLRDTASATLVEEIQERGKRYGHATGFSGDVWQLQAAHEVRAVVVADALGRIMRSQGAAVRVTCTTRPAPEWETGLGVRLDAYGKRVFPGPLVVNIRPAPALSDPVRLGRDAGRWALLHPASHDGPRIGDDYLVQRESNPLFRVRYAHARIRAVSRNAADLGFDAEPQALPETEARPKPQPRPRPGTKSQTEPEPGTDTATDAKNLLTHLADHPRVLAHAAEDRAPDRLARHLVTVADAVTPLLAAVLPCGEEKPSAAHRARLALAEAAGTVLAGGLSLLGIDAPEHL
ncbi:ArgS-related anticodon-binding protein NrtL [Streptomyces lincolnensis]|uniref:ArgS-related anticodon-binding protein NrtL n=1 Tax=Streptomyces lincolnensis TaxID=1915 RepID=UPI0037CF1AFD